MARKAAVNPARNGAQTLPESLPIWRKRIAAATRTHGQLKALAVAAEMPSQQLKKLANGVTADPRVETLARVARAMGKTLAELFDDTRPEQEPGREAQPAVSKGVAILNAAIRALDAEDSNSGQTWREDVVEAIGTLARALRRSTDPGPSGATPVVPRR